MFLSFLWSNTVRFVAHLESRATNEDEDLPKSKEKTKENTKHIILKSHGQYIKTWKLKAIIVIQ